MRPVRAVARLAVTAAAKASPSVRVPLPPATFRRTTSTMSSPYTLEPKVSIAQLDANVAFSSLTSAEAKYALALAKSQWAGAKICLLQCSRESVPTFALLRLALSPGAAAVRAAALAAGVSEADYDLFAVFAATFSDNLGNYKSFGDTKFVPGCPESAFETILRSSPAYAANASKLETLWAAVRGPLYALEPARVRQLGFGPSEGVTTYYSADVTKEDAELVQRFSDSLKLTQLYNSRVFKTGPAAFQLRLASAAPATEWADEKDATELRLGTHAFEGATIEVVRGDYAPLLRRVVAHLEEAIPHAANDRQREMLRLYASSFRRGSMLDHIAGSAEWVKDVGPSVESYVGFIESYRDPLGVRGEWEGFVAVVNKQTSAKFAALVEGAEELLKLMPWPQAFEKDTFLRPDFTALEVLAFPSSGIPAGINIPNYVELRQTHGFKNVSLSNVLSARNITERVTFLADEDQAVYRAKLSPAFELQVGLHELLGHGSGKLFQEDADGKLNFDPAAVAPLLPPGASPTYYKPGTSWDTVFGGLASTMEECRAEAVGIYLCTQPSALRVFGHAEGEESSDIVYVNWLNMARAGLLALQYYTPATKSWGQAHMQARYALLRVMLEAGEGFVELVGADGLTEDKVAAILAAGGDGEGGITVRLDRSKIQSVGLPAVGAFLRSLQVYKATANVADGAAHYQRLTAIPDAYLPLRSLVIAKRKPRQMFVQPILREAKEVEEAASAGLPRQATVVRGGAGQEDVALLTFPATVDGLIDAFVARWPEEDEELLALWEEEQARHVVV